jgi:hypothetical protein
MSPLGDPTPIRLCTILFGSFGLPHSLSHFICIGSIYEIGFQG